MGPCPPSWTTTTGGGRPVTPLLARTSATRTATASWSPMAGRRTRRGSTRSPSGTTSGRSSAPTASGWPETPPSFAARAGRMSGLRGHVVDELLGRIGAPLTDEGLLDREEVRAAPGIQTVGIGPLLVDPAPGVAPVIVDLAAQEMAAHALHVLVLS